MKIVYIGDCDCLAAATMERMKKEEHDIYFLSDVPVDAREKRFSKYRNYQIKGNGTLESVFTAIRPDTVIFAGMQSGKEKNLSLIAETLEECVRMETEMFVCLSSTEVYGKDRTEDSALFPESPTGMWWAQMEGIAQMYQKRYQMRVAILRLEGYFSNEISVGAQDLLGTTAQAIVSNRNMKIVEQILYPVHVADAADAVKRVVEAKKAAVYNICSSFAIKKSALIRMVAAIMEKEVVLELEESSEDTSPLSNAKIKKELEWTDFWQLERIAQDGALHLTYPKRTETAANKKKIPNEVRRTLENLVLFLVFGLCYVLSKDHTLFSQIHWLLIYVVVVSLFYGVRQGAVSVLAASALHLVLHEGSLFEMTNFYSYVEDVLIIVQYIFFGIVVGYTVDMLRSERQNQEQELELLKENYEDLQDIHEKSILVKDEYEKRVLDAKTSLPYLYNIINKISTLDVERIFVEVLNVVKELLHTDTVCVYKVNENTPYLRLIASLNEESPIAGRSWNLEQFPQIQQAIAKGEIYEGDIWNQEPAIILPVVSPQGCPAVIVVKNLPMESMSLYTINLLRTLMVLISESMEQALNYESIARKEKYVDDTDILKPEEFDKAVALAEEKRERKLADYSVLKLDTGLGLIEAYEKTGSMFRQVDVLGTDGKGSLYVLLGNASNQDTSIVLERLEKKNIMAEEIEWIKF